MLEEEIKFLKQQNENLISQNALISKENTFLKNYSIGGQFCTIAIALEKVTEAVAYVLSDLKKR